VALKAGSAPDQALQLVLGHGILCASEASLGELGAVFSRPKFDCFLALDARISFSALLRAVSRIVPLTAEQIATVSPTCHDLRDYHVLALALAAVADAIVSSDEDLLVLHPWNGIPILRPADFLL
jgi:hypothetical protein